MSQIGKKDDAEQVNIEHVFPIKKNLTAVSDEMKQTMATGVEMAIIGFWSKNDKDEFKCYHYFYVPNPMKREIRRSDRKDWQGNQSTISVHQILYYGHDGDDVFFFFNKSKVDKKFDISIGILNLEEDPQVNSNSVKCCLYDDAKNTKAIFPFPV